MFWLMACAKSAGCDARRSQRWRVFLAVSFVRAARAFALILTSAAMAGGLARAAESPSAAQDIYASAPPRLLQIRTLVAGAGRQASIGSGFLVSADGLAVTNYHVVSQFVLEPQTYRLEYIAADGSHGEARVLGVDLPNDLAIVRLDKHDAPFFSFDAAAIAGNLAKGERLYSMGNPLDLGFTITEGTYNGLVEHSYNEQVHFTAALNPGMSGGPAVTAQGSVVGVNVATRRGGQLISFLVPARFAAALVERVRGHSPPTDLRAEVGRQLTASRTALYKAFAEKGFRSDEIGPYRALGTSAPWFNCWSDTNAGAIPKPRASINSTRCSSDTGLFVASDLHTGTIEINHSVVRAVDLNQFQLAAVLTQQSQPRLVVAGPFRKWYTPERCHDDFVSAASGADHPPLRVIWCTQGYRAFEGLYDVVMTAVTQDRGGEALVSRLSLQAVGYDDAISIGRRFLEAIQVAK
jgi:S1-C subfamily serine protease